MNAEQIAPAPLVSIGIPTYERSRTLGRAIDSALGQSYRDIELVICDDGSRDATEKLCREIAARDRRVRYLRSPTNLGLAANHNKLFAEMRGEYAMLLSDDDWLEPNYVERCLTQLQANPDYVLVCGVARYLKAGEPISEGITFRLGQDSPAQRIRTYLSRVDENGLLYGLMPRDALMSAAPMHNVLGTDWLLVMGVLAQGKALTVTDTAILRELGGTSAGFAKLVSTFGLPRWQACVPHLVIAWQIFAAIAWRASAFRALAPRARAALMLTAPCAAIRWRSLAWHMTMPTLANLGKRPGGRWMWRCYLRLARLAGASGDGQDHVR